MKIRKRVLLATSAAPSQSPFANWEKRPPHGVGFLISMLRNAGHEVFFIDNYLEPTNFLETGYLQSNQIDYIGLSVNTICFRDTLRMLHKIEYLRRSGQWQGKIILGGPHTSVAIETIPMFVDHIVQGEGEQAIVDIVEGKVRDRIVRYPRLRDLDALPVPAWDLFTKLPYNWEVPWFPENPVFNLTTSRGCPFNCAFCSNESVWGKMYTAFSAGRVVAEIEHLIVNYGAKGIYFRENNFTANRKRVFEFCNLLLEKGIEIHWACESRVDSLDRNLLELMHKAGARGFYFGVESGSQRILDYVNKRITVDQIRNTFRMCHDIGFKTAASIVVGLPHETEEDLAATDKLLKEINPTMIWSNVFVGIPNSKLYRYVVEQRLYEFIDDRGLIYLKGHNERTRRYYQNAWDADVPFRPKSPCVSVIMPAHNAATFIEAAIQSILTQTHQDFELIVVNDGSTDDTKAILQQFHDPRISVIDNPIKLGQPKSRNNALESAKGKYIAVMDADDISIPHRLEMQIRFLESNPDYALVGSYAYQIDESGRYQSIIKLQTEDSVIRKFLIHGNNFVHGSVMVRRNVLHEIGGYDERFDYAADYDLWLRIIDVCKVANLPEPLYCWRSSSTQISTAKKAEQDAFAEMARREARERADADRMQTDKVCSEAHSLAMAGRLDEAVEILDRRIAGKPNDALAHFYLGQLRERREELSTARACYEKAVSLEPTNISFLKHLAGFLLVEEGSTGSALAIYDKVLNLAPRDSETLLVRGNIAASIRHYGEAERFYKKVLDVDPGNVNATENLETLSKLQQKDIQDAARKAATPVHKTQSRKTLEAFEVAAIISAHNEGDVIYHVIGDLIHQGVSVYLLDHRSTDNTVSEASKWLGKGLIHIESYPDDAHYAEENKTRYIWRDILTRKAELAAQLDADWFIHADADEFRESPWPGLTLREAFHIVDRLGYNAIDFELLNFRPVDNSFVPGKDVRQFLHHYEGCENYNTKQVKAWKNLGVPVDLVTSGGHDISFEGRKVFPIRFIHRHYPIRSQHHGLLKVFHQRKNRFCAEEKAMAWHVQYDHVRDENHNFIRRAEDLHRYDPVDVRLRLLGSDPYTVLSRFQNDATANPHAQRLEPFPKMAGVVESPPDNGGRKPDASERIAAAEAHEGILKLLVAAGKRAEAVFALERLGDSFPDYAPAHNDLGFLYGESGDLPRALSSYEKAVSLDPANATFRKNLGDFHYVAMKQPEAAVLQYEQALRLDPQDTETLLILGNLRVESGHFREARELYLRALELDPSNELAGRMFDAIDAGREAIVEPDPDTLYREARSLVQRGRPDEAIGTLEKLLRACPEHSLAQNDLGCLLFGRGEAEKARIHYEKAVAADPHNIMALKNLADVYFVEAGRIEDALQLYHRILQEQPRDVEALRAIGSICVRLERYTDAAEIFRLIRALDPADEESVRILENLGALPDSVPPASTPRHQPGDGLICHYPFHFMQIFYDKVYFCCPDWTKFSIGNLREQSLAEIWNSPTARFIRQKMYRNEWEDICNPCCPYIAAHRASGKRIPYASLEDYRVLTPGQIRQIRSKHDFMEHPPTGFKIDNSNTCNLDCLMCTRHANADDPELIRKTEAEIAPFLPTAKVIYLTGNGEPLAIRHTREMISGDYSFNPDLEFNLITNGLLLPKFWDQIQHQKFGDLMISIDAATKTTYEKIRRGGTWESLMKSLALVNCNRDRFRSVTINMTVMRENYREIPAFIDLAAAFGFSASFQRIRGTFDKQNIFDPAEREALRELERIIRHEAATRQDAPVSWGDLIDFTASGNSDVVKDAPRDNPSPMQAADSANSIGRNRQYWSLYDWTERGNEWSAAWGGTENLWRGTILPRIGALLPAGHILEIAPGYGRCTQYLATQCRSMTLVDLTEKCIEACKQRFRDLPNIRYIVNDGKSLEAVENESVDFVFSWDSLVHVEKDVMEAYLHQLASKLKTGGMGFLHHSNIGAFRNSFTGDLSVENRHWRGESMSAELFRAYCREAGLRCLSQEIIGWGGEVLNDCFSVITKGSAQPDQPPRVVENPHFMQEASGRANPPDFYRALGIRKGSFAAAAPEESYRKARGFIEESKFTEAAGAMEDYLLARSGDALAHNDLGCLYYRLGERDKTLEHYEKAVELEPGNATYMKNLADFYQVEQGRTDDALRLYHRILADHPGDMETLLALGHVCIAVARLDDARTFFERALATDPYNETARTILAQLRSRPDRMPAEDAREGEASVSIIIPAGDDPKILSRCIGTVLQNTEGADYEIVMTSGLAPASGEESFVPVEGKSIRLTVLPVNGNPIASLNAAARKASGRYVVCMDPRILLSRGWLEPLLKTAVSNPMAGAVSPRVGMPPDTLIEAGFTVLAGDTAKGNGEGERIDTPRYNFACETPSGSRYMTLMPKAAWEQCGGFDEELKDFGMALMDLSLSIRQAGKNLFYQPLSTVGLVEHLNPAASGKLPTPAEAGQLSRLRPATARNFFSEGAEQAGQSVLVIGVYLADRLNTAEDIASVLSASKTCRVTQRWVALGDAPPVPALASVTARAIREKTPKFQIVNDLLAREELSRYDYVLLTDDDVVMPEGFLDAFIGLQEKLGFAVAQPARTSNSYIDHPIVEQANGLLARETRFVEIGPVVSFHRSAYDLVFPFDLTSPMGWGYENVWSFRLLNRGLKMGIIDVTPVDHSIRKPVANYDWSEADRQRADFLDRNEHLPLETCFTTLQAIRLEGESK